MLPNTIHISFENIRMYDFNLFLAHSCNLYRHEYIANVSEKNNVSRKDAILSATLSFVINNPPVRWIMLARVTERVAFVPEPTARKMFYFPDETVRKNLGNYGRFAF